MNQPCQIKDTHWSHFIKTHKEKEIFFAKVLISIKLGRNIQPNQRDQQLVIKTQDIAGSYLTSTGDIDKVLCNHRSQKMVKEMQCPIIFRNHGIADGVTSWLIKKRNQLLNPKYLYFLLLLDRYLTQILFGGEREMFTLGEYECPQKIRNSSFPPKYGAEQFPNNFYVLGLYCSANFVNIMSTRNEKKTTKKGKIPPHLQSTKKLIPVNKNTKNGIQTKLKCNLGKKIKWISSDHPQSLSVG